MKKSLYSIPLLLLAGCAATSETAMSPQELQQCLQPNRRVVVEVVGRTLKPPAKKPAAKPGAAAKPAAKPAKPAKPQFVNFAQSFHIQGNTAFDPNSATLKPGGQKDIDSMMALLKKRAVQVSAIIVTGHTDRLERDKALSEQRAVAAKNYLVSRGADEKIIFWEGKEAREPVAVTKFCSY